MAAGLFWLSIRENAEKGKVQDRDKVRESGNASFEALRALERGELDKKELLPRKAEKLKAELADICNCKQADFSLVMDDISNSTEAFVFNNDLMDSYSAISDRSKPKSSKDAKTQADFRYLLYTCYLKGGAEKASPEKASQQLLTLIRPTPYSVDLPRQVQALNTLNGLFKRNEKQRLYPDCISIAEKISNNPQIKVDSAENAFQSIYESVRQPSLLKSLEKLFPALQSRYSRQPDAAPKLANLYAVWALIEFDANNNDMAFQLVPKAVKFGRQSHTLSDVTARGLHCKSIIEMQRNQVQSADADAASAFNICQSVGNDDSERSTALNLVHIRIKENGDPRGIYRLFEQVTQYTTNLYNHSANSNEKVQRLGELEEEYSEYVAYCLGIDQPTKAVSVLQESDLFWRTHAPANCHRNPNLLLQKQDRRIQDLLKLGGGSKS